jgi:hypothetical protein
MLALVVTFTAFSQERTRDIKRVWGERYKPSQTQRNTQTQSPSRQLFNLSNGGSAVRRVIHWNSIAIDASGLDHTPVPPGDPRVFGEQLGPGRSARAMAIVHIAIFDAINAIDGKYAGYTGIPRAQNNTSIDSAIAQAAHDTLVGCAVSLWAVERRKQFWT